jgi:hypothetical protein
MRLATFATCVWLTLLGAIGLAPTTRVLKRTWKSLAQSCG